jgi:hypothetical protein
MNKWQNLRYKQSMKLTEENFNSFDKNYHFFNIAMFFNKITKEQKPISLHDSNIKELDDYLLLQFITNNFNKPKKK